MSDLLGDLSAIERLEATLWARFEEAAVKVRCPVDQIRCYFQMAVNTCRPDGVRSDLTGQKVGPMPEQEVLEARYRVALTELLECLDTKRLEETFAQLVRDA
jgi:hypothetical protein